MGHIKEGLLLQWIWGFINKEAEETDQLELLKIHCPSVPPSKTRIRLARCAIWASGPFLKVPQGSLMRSWCGKALG